MLELGSHHEGTVHFDLGLLSVRAGDLDEAEAAFEKAVALRGNFTEALFNLALLAYKREKRPEAIGFLEQILAYDGAHRKSLLLMAALQSNHSRLEK